MIEEEANKEEEDTDRHLRLAKKEDSTRPGTESMARDEMCRQNSNNHSEMIETEVLPRRQVILYTNTFHTPRYGPGGEKIRPGTREEGTGTTKYGSNHKMVQCKKSNATHRRNNNRKM